MPEPEEPPVMVVPPVALAPDPPVPPEAVVFPPLPFAPAPLEPMTPLQATPRNAASEHPRTIEKRLFMVLLRLVDQGLARASPRNRSRACGATAFVPITPASYPPDRDGVHTEQRIQMAADCAADGCRVCTSRRTTEPRSSHAAPVKVCGACGDEGAPFEGACVGSR